MEDSKKIPQHDLESMCNDKSILIENLDLSVVIDFFSQMDRQGPGSEEITLKALNFIDLTGSVGGLRIADMGCGTGGQTISLAHNTSAHITAFDIFPGMIDVLQHRVRKLGLHKRITGVVASMDRIPFDGNGFDVIWAEGAIYHIGFERGLNLWTEYLKKGGYVAVSDMVWLSDKRPAEIERYMCDNVPEINTPSYKIRQIEEAGYLPVASFFLPDNCWTENYYRPMAELFEGFLKEQGQSKAVVEFVERQREEIAMYEKYSEYYGYMFFIAKKII